MSEKQRRIPVKIMRAEDDGHPQVSGRLLAGRTELCRADRGTKLTVWLPAGRYSLIAETAGSRERDGAALCLRGDETEAEVVLRAVEAWEGRIRLMIDRVKAR